MTRYPRHLYLLLVAGAMGLAACSSSTSTGVSDPSALAEGALLERTFQIEDVSGRGIVDSSNVTLMFGADGRFSGSTGCNTVFGPYEITGAALEFGPLASTKKLCAPSLMNQEQAVLSVLSRATRVELDREGALILRADDGGSLRGFESTRPTLQTYLCDDGATLEVGYPTQDTARIVHRGRTLDMTLAQSASGARYIGSGWEWWSKGRLQASLAPLSDDGRIVPERRVTCRLDVSAAPDNQVAS